MDRKSITFEQAEGAAPLPSQLKPKELSKELRALLWSAVYESLQDCIVKGDFIQSRISGTWEIMLREKHIFRDHGMIDELRLEPRVQIEKLKAVYANGDYVNVLGLTEWFIRHPASPKDLRKVVESILQYSNTAYRVIDGCIVPIGTEVEAATIQQAFDDLEASEFNGARTHLKNAGSALTNGEPAESVRESVHAVESVARMLAPSAKLSEALAVLEAKANMHGSMRKAFAALYGYASDEQGIRHPLLEEGDAKVDEADALFMIGACAAFVSYMISKGRNAGIIPD
jgi:hypothetical protein